MLHQHSIRCMARGGSVSLSRRSPPELTLISCAIAAKNGNEPMVVVAAVYANGLNAQGAIMWGLGFALSPTLLRLAHEPSQRLHCSAQSCLGDRDAAWLRQGVLLFLAAPTTSRNACFP